MNKLLRYTTLFVLLVFAAMGIAFTIKASIGLGAFDAINQTLSFLLGIKVGSIMTFFQLLFVIIQFLLLKNNLEIKLFLQIPMAIIMGELVNIFYYTVFGRIVFTNYLISFISYIFGMTWLAFFMSGVMVLDLITIPIESLPMVISKKINKPYGKIRQLFDIIFIIISLLISLIFSLPLTVREGTLIGALLFGPLLSIFMPIIKNIFINWKLIEQ